MTERPILPPGSQRRRDTAGMPGSTSHRPTAAPTDGLPGTVRAGGGEPGREIAALHAEVEDLQRQLEAAREEGEERLGQIQRLRADHVNYRRRTEQERAEERQRASAMLIIKLLPALDDFDRALDTVGSDLAGLHWVQGIGHIARKLRQTLESEGLARIEALGQPFDPARHEAVLREETDDEHVGRVLSVMQHGYRLHDRVIRPAMVKVGVPRSTAARTEHE